MAAGVVVPDPHLWVVKRLGLPPLFCPELVDAPLVSSVGNMFLPPCSPHVWCGFAGTFVVPNSPVAILRSYGPWCEDAYLPLVVSPPLLSPGRISPALRFSLVYVPVFCPQSFPCFYWLSLLVRCAPESLSPVSGHSCGPPVLAPCHLQVWCSSVAARFLRTFLAPFCPSRCICPNVLAPRCLVHIFLAQGSRPRCLTSLDSVTSLTVVQSDSLTVPTSLTV